MLSNYILICDTIVQLMHPLVEIVIHNIQSNNIIYIKGSLSTREINDQSLLDTENLSDINQSTYSKINFDGRLIKSISIILEDKWLMCINCDISIFSQIQKLTNSILQNTSTIQPKSLFKNDWRERIHMTIHNYIQDHHLSFEHLNILNKKELVTHLFNLQAFNEKNSVDYVAKVLTLGRATVFKYLKALRK